MARRIVPMIFVPDVRATIKWYEAIGFSVTATRHDEADSIIDWASLSYGASEIMVGGGGRPNEEYRRQIDLYIYTDDVDGLYQRLKDSVEVHQTPQETYYNTKEFIVRDNNGFWLTFGQQLDTKREAKSS